MIAEANQPPRQSSDPAPPKQAVPVPSKDLLHGARELLIEHEGEIYRLRVTRNGKLILHK